ncbi:uncharacterized protein LOC126900553 [Daktulosphaira vitifoliae]|uniref:uncharacterized protein LOC126900553 n=1 Tax=Daktulosphaira vitifoliae TaxID=58002 RepID=UPI0021A97EDE|nr:uncharacterized protein LOC126900553 [Daktulosphaira vitifoliae]
MDLVDPKFKRADVGPPIVRCKERKRKESGRKSPKKTKDKSKCPSASASSPLDKGMTTIAQKPAQINPLMTILMNSRQQQQQQQQHLLQYDQPAIDKLPERMSACRTLVLQLPEHLDHSEPKRSVPISFSRKLPVRKCIVPDEFKLKMCLQW